MTNYSALLSVKLLTVQLTLLVIIRSFRKGSHSNVG